eukprot:TRINITY_DN9822_c0_g1_i1.p1 TRINITY_DN9822_c0_g1~~TRINITY_DN9822_c0_g1_i1.p1  ORF type:complete len:61 (-),score=1.55 TRINITY_DN9822_c0_g1_i1:181-363(-)
MDCCSSSLFSQFVWISILYTFGILYPALVVAFDSGYGLTSMVGSVNQAIYLVSEHPLDRQ